MVLLGGIALAGALAIYALGGLPGREEGQPADAGGGWPWAVHLNGIPVARAASAPNGEPRVPVADIRSMLDGDTGLGPSHLQLDGARLHGVGRDGCPLCPARVRRPVLISSAVESLHGEATIPLEDLVRAFEGRLQTLEDRRVYAVYVGLCGWCILEPRTRPSDPTEPPVGSPSPPAHDAGDP